MDQAPVAQDISIDDVMTRRFALVEEIAIIQGRHKSELEPLNDELNMCEQFIKAEMLKQNMQQVKTGAGMAFFTTKDSVTVDDFDAFIEHIRSSGDWQLLNKAANKTATKEFLETNKAPPPGVKYDSYRDLSWRRGKG